MRRARLSSMISLDNLTQWSTKLVKWSSNQFKSTNLMQSKQAASPYNSNWMSLNKKYSACKTFWRRARPLRRKRPPKPTLTNARTANSRFSFKSLRSRQARKWRPPLRAATNAQQWATRKPLGWVTLKVAQSGVQGKVFNPWGRRRVF